MTVSYNKNPADATRKPGFSPNKKGVLEKEVNCRHLQKWRLVSQRNIGDSDVSNNISLFRLHHRVADNTHLAKEIYSETVIILS